MTFDVFSLLAGLGLGAVMAGVAVWLWAGRRVVRLEADLAHQQARDAELSEHFKVLAQDVLRQSREDLMQQAQADLGHKNEAIKTQFEQMNKLMREIEGKREEAYHSLGGVIRQLHSETSKLAQAMRSSTARGQWGELQLRRVVEIAGLTEKVDFDTQVTAQDGSRPDMVIHMPGGGRVYVDAKAPLEPLLQHQRESADGAEMDAATLDAFASKLEAHARILGRRRYHERDEDSPEFTILFLPSEYLFAAALRQRANLIEIGIEQNVLIATPTTLIALLRTVALGWRQEALARNAREVRDLGAELYNRLATMSSHFANLGKKLGGAVTDYNKAMGSYERMVLPQARKIRDLKATQSDQDKLPPMEPLDATPREISLIEADSIQKIN